jgi:hypothetical protein
MALSQSLDRAPSPDTSGVRRLRRRFLSGVVVVLTVLGMSTTGAATGAGGPG